MNKKQELELYLEIRNILQNPEFNQFEKEKALVSMFKTELENKKFDEEMKNG